MSRGKVSPGYGKTPADVHLYQVTREYEVVEGGDVVRTGSVTSDLYANLGQARADCTRQQVWAARQNWRFPGRSIEVTQETVTRFRLLPEKLIPERWAPV